MWAEIYHKESSAHTENKKNKHIKKNCDQFKTDETPD